MTHYVILVTSLILCAQARVLPTTDSEEEMKNFKIYPNKRNEDAQFWLKSGRDEVEVALNRFRNLLGNRNDENLNYEFLDSIKRPKNLVLFIGDGLGIATVTASRIYKGQSRFGLSGEETQLLWEKFPEVALLKTYNVDYQTPDSAGTANALFSGVKTTYKTMGFDSSIVHKSPSSHLKAREVTTLLQWAQEAGKRTGFVTTSRLTHATPAALYAHSASRDWECDAFMTKKTGHVLPHEEDPDPDLIYDIGRQLVHRQPGNRTNVILGGGRMALRANPSHLNVTLDKWTCERKDGRDLISDWKNEKEEMSPGRNVVAFNKEDLLNVDPAETDYLLGAFSPTHMSYADERDSNSDQPNLKEMSTKAVEILKRSQEGFFLMVEGARIDHAHHDGFVNRALEETVGFEEALEAVIKSLEESDQLDETLIVVTADHSHVMTILGYPKRGADIRGVTGTNATDGLPMPILSYANGPGYTKPLESTSCSRQDLSEVNMFEAAHKPPATFPMGIESHGGEDVGLWATGPMSFLFHKTHEQSYVAHATSFALCIGHYVKHPACVNFRSQQATGSANNFSNSRNQEIRILATFLVVYKYF